MQPQYPQQPAQGQYPQQPQQGYPVQPAYPAQPYPQQPAPQFPQQPQQGYPVQPQYPQGYGQSQYGPPAPPAPPLPTGTLDSFYQQPSSSGGPSFKFMDANRQPQIGKYYEGIVARPVTDADIRAQTDQAGNPQTFRDGRTKFVMVVPMQVAPSQEFPEGQAGWWVKGQARDELARAMAEAGAPAGAPEAGAFIRVTLVGLRQIPGRNPAYQYRVEYVRPGGAAPAPTAAPVQQATQQPVQQATPVMSTATGQPVVRQQPVPPMPQPMAPQVQQIPRPPVQAMPAQPMQQSVPGAAPAPAPAPQPVTAPAGAAPAGFNAEQHALFTKLTGGQAAPTA